MKNLKKAYKRLNVKAYKGIIKETMIPYFDDYDGEFVAMLTPETTFTIEKHYYDNIFMGWNIKADGVLLETKSTKRKAVRFIKRLKGNKKNAFLSDQR